MYFRTILFLTATIVPLIVTGRPQIGGLWLADPTSTAGSKSELSGLVKLEFFIRNGKEPHNGNGNLVKVYGSEATFEIPTGNRNSLCPEDQLMNEPDGKCYMKGSPLQPNSTSNPCHDDFEVFAEIEGKPGYGSCYCVRFRGSTTRPVVSWPQSNRCFWLYDQGPCSKGEWLVFSNITDADGSKNLICAKRTCPENVVNPFLSFPNFWFEHKGKCYQTGAPNPEFCPEKVKNKIYFSKDKPEPVCLERWPIISTVKGFASGAGNLGCKAGQKQLPNGQCKRVATFD